MKRLFATLLGAVLVAGLASCGGGGGERPLDDSPEGQAVQFRQSVMRSLGYKVAAVRAMASGEVPADEAKFRKDTADVAALAGMLPEGFIPSSSAAESNANPEVWTNMADFQQKAADLKNAADALALPRRRKASRPRKAWCRPPVRRAALAIGRIGGERKTNNSPQIC